jgi:carbamoyl-phosphate synthase small subunit
LGRIEPEKPEGGRWLGGHYEQKDDKTFFDPGQYEILNDVSVKERTRLGKGSTRIALLDCGVKWNIIRQLIDLQCEVELIPWNHDLSKVDCDAWLLSNGPGDPAKTGDLTKRIAKLLEGNQPILGICLGHQLLSLAAGAKTERMTYGHRSHNQPVYEVGTRRGYITSQNHGYVVVDKSLPEGWEAWFRNINDETIEGIRHVSKPFRSVQFHPEAAGGPRDTGWILEQFVAEVLK